MAGNIDINKGTVDAQIAKIVSDTNTFLTDIASEYEAVAATLSRSQGDFIDALKVQLSCEAEILQEAGNFFKTLVDMLQAAKSDFESLDTSYSDTKIT